MKRVVIVAAKRTPFGRFLGSLRSQSPSDLAAAAGEATLSRIDRSQVDQVILGNILGTGHGMNIARQVALRLKLPIKTSATTLNMMCGSGMQAAMFAVRDWYRHHNLTVRDWARRPEDHLVLQLRFVAFLFALDAGGEAGSEAQLAPLDEAARFLDAHDLQAQSGPADRGCTGTAARRAGR